MDFLWNSAWLCVNQLLLLATHSVGASEFFPLRFITEWEREFRKNKSCFPPHALQPALSLGCKLCWCAASEGLASLAAESSVHAGRTILEEAPFVGLVRSASWGVLAAAFVAASAERLHSACPGSSLLTMSWLTYSGSLGEKKLNWWQFWAQGNKSSGRGRGWCGDTQQWCFCLVWKQSRQDCGGAAQRSRVLC